MIDGNEKCMICGYDYSLHHADTQCCPKGGEVPVGYKQTWLSSVFTPVPGNGIENQLNNMEVGDWLSINERSNLEVNFSEYTEVLCVPGGWIFYRHYRHTGQYESITACFVPNLE